MNSLIIGVHQSKKQRILFKVRCFFLIYKVK